MSLKLKAVEYAEKTSKEAAARHFGVNAGNGVAKETSWCR